jgi:hypothetical protein
VDKFYSQREAVWECRDLRYLAGSEPRVGLQGDYKDFEHASPEIWQGAQSLAHLLLGIRFYQQTGAVCVGTVPDLPNEVLEIQSTASFEFIFGKDRKISFGTIPVHPFGYRQKLHFVLLNPPRLLPDWGTERKQ